MIADICYRQGQLERAEVLYKKALLIRELVLGDGHPDVAKTIHGLAYLLTTKGLYNEAESLHKRYRLF